MSDLALREKLYSEGPFPGRIDPWIEDDHYFHPLHNQMIGELLTELRKPLFDRGYAAGRETSLQILDGREPDIYVRQKRPSQVLPRFDYDLAAAELLVEPGVRAVDEPLIDALTIRDGKSGDLVTVLEIVSPGNKKSRDAILAYQERRTRLYLEQGINVVEVDMTRSAKRLVNASEAAHYAYHIAVFILGDPVRITGIPFENPIKPIALPLRQEAIALDLHPVYAKAYADTNMSWHIRHDGNYIDEKLPAPSMMTDLQRQQAVEAVKFWAERLRQAGEHSE